MSPQFDGSDQHRIRRGPVLPRLEIRTRREKAADICAASQRRESADLHREHLQVPWKTALGFARLFQLLLMLAQHVQHSRQVLPVDPCAVQKPVIRIELAQRVQRRARAIDSHRGFCERIDSVRAGRELDHRAGRLECHFRIALANREYPCQVRPIERRETRRRTLHDMRERLRRRELPDIHVGIGGENEREPERGVRRRCAFEMHDRATRVELGETIQPGDEFLIGLERGWLTGGGRPTVEPRIEQRCERRHDSLAQRFHRLERLPQRGRYRIYGTQQSSIFCGGDLHLKPDTVALAVITTGNHGSRTRRLSQGADRRRIAQTGTGCHGRCHHRHRGHDFDEARLRESLRHPIGGHEPEVIERCITRAIFHRRDRHAALVKRGRRLLEKQAACRNSHQRHDDTRREHPAPAPSREDAARRCAHAMGSPSEPRDECLRAGEAVVRQRRDRLRDDVLYCARHARRRLAQRRTRFQRGPVMDQPLGECDDCRFSRKHLEQDTAEAVHVRARIGRQAEGLLGTHVPRRADGLARLRDREIAGGADRARDAEIGNHRVVRREQNVFRLDVAVDDALRVGERERVSDVAGNVQRRLES